MQIEVVPLSSSYINYSVHLECSLTVWLLLDLVRKQVFGIVAGKSTELLHHQIDHCEDFLFCASNGREVLEVNCDGSYVTVMIFPNFFM